MRTDGLVCTQLRQWFYQAKPQRATRKVSSYAVEDSDAHDSDSEEVTVVSKPSKPATAGAKGRGKAAATKAKATAKPQKMELGSDDDGIFDSDGDVSGKQVQYWTKTFSAVFYPARRIFGIGLSSFIPR